MCFSDPLQILAPSDLGCLGNLLGILGLCILNTSIPLNLGQNSLLPIFNKASESSPWGRRHPLSVVHCALNNLNSTIEHWVRTLLVLYYF